MLTDAAVRKAKAADRDYKLSDSGGLHLFVTKSGHRSWRLKYRFGGKERRLVLGAYPEIGLVAARQMRDDAKRLLREGRDPAYERKKARLANVARHENTFERFAREWHELQKDRWTKVHADDVLTSLERDVFPAIGSLAVTDIDEALVLAVLRPVQQRGAIETSHRLRQRMSAIFKFAKPNAGNGNPTDVAESLKSVPPGRRWPALTKLDQIHDLIAAVDSAGANPVTRLASRFMALTAQRPGMIRSAPWKELEGIDWRSRFGSAASTISRPEGLTIYFAVAAARSEGEFRRRLAAEMGAGLANRARVARGIDAPVPSLPLFVTPALREVLTAFERGEGPAAFSFFARHHANYS